ncbi:PEGA domain-containing protein [Carboxylicivirga marina]|uniref:PEGA domain-containing protein n=1 Tax=Carboxylicivirga marina TaxID=2800988 RepID=A0ABS1HET8_9BACT|nr:PEGA domain-containing protein [Carboxylicivirga marina]MBK3516189.1 PEGA domain-containing protein [Carboxylicivirga marina]
MNKIIVAILAIALGVMACDSGADKQTKTPLVKISAEEQGHVYLDGQYTGYTTPTELKVSKGEHVISVTAETSKRYMRQEVTINEDTEVQLTMKDVPEPKVWKALWIGVQEVIGNSVDGQCSSSFSQEELDAGFEFFQWSIDKQFHPFSYNTTKWEVERKDITTPIELHKASNTWFTLEPESITELLPEVKPGNYDAVFVFWRESDGDCSFKSSYFGLAWTDPLNDPIKTGYITIKFDAGDDINKNINWYKENDPGVWVHEWLHTVGENYFQNCGERLPEKGGDGLVLHAAEKYKYTYPWMDWYADFMSGRVKDLGSGNTYCGIGPEAFLKYTVRESALNQ